ncbi:MAG: S9 family peptidase [Ignavibacteria bacterium]|jgi:dipeptidyl aminopeptidase/acylaminoacyl peptidase
MRLKLKKNFIFFTITLFATFASGCKPGKEEVPILPIKNFFRISQKTDFLISPVGTKVSFLQSENSKWDLYIKNLSNNQIDKVTSFNSERIVSYTWINENQILLTNKRNRDEKFKLYLADIDKKEIKNLIPEENKIVEVIDYLPEIENEVIVKANFIDDNEFDVYRLNIITGEYKLTSKNPGNIIHWLTDNIGTLRIAVKTDGVNTGLLYRKNDNEKFKLVKLTNFKDLFEPLFFTFDDKYIYALSNLNRDKAAIVKYDIENDVEIETIFKHHEVDALNLLRSNKREKIIAATYVDFKKKYKFFTSKEDSIHCIIQNKFPGKEINYINKSADENKILFKTDSDKSLGVYYLFSVSDNSFLQLENLSPWINENNMAAMKPIWYRTKDGLSIRGYLTLPPNKHDHKNLPTIIIPNNSYWKRLTWGFNKEVQFLANRGYAVLQINIRGSFGYGKKYWQAGFNEMGGKIQDDIADGVAWLIEQNIADPGRIAVYGHSYGGYLALTSITFNPDLYKCGISYGGIVDVMGFMSRIPSKFKPFVDMLYETMGNPVTEKEHLENISPINNTEKIKVPLLIAHGSKDNKVEKKGVDKFVAELQAKNIPVEYFIGKNEGHVFRNEKNIIKFYRSIENFLFLNLKGRKRELH